uniref:Uncharacterized protein n=1 Tax=Romanomermis culicivorax TaxID=13658 RepID=A0A915HPY7_ROMCU
MEIRTVDNNMLIIKIHVVFFPFLFLILNFDVHRFSSSPLTVHGASVGETCEQIENAAEPDARKVQICRQKELTETLIDLSTILDASVAAIMPQYGIVPVETDPVVAKRKHEFLRFGKRNQQHEFIRFGKRYVVHDEDFENYEKFTSSKTNIFLDEKFKLYLDVPSIRKKIFESLKPGAFLYRASN